MRMKQIWIVAVAACAALAFTACGRPAGNTQTPPASTVAEPGTKKSAPAASSEAPVNTEEFKILTGNVEAVSDSLDEMTVNNGGANVKFDLSGVGVETSYELEKGTPVTVIYKGEISGEDSSNANIVLVVDAQENIKVQTMTGSVKDQAMSTFVIQNESGEEVTFLRDNCEGLDSGALGQATDDSNGSGAMVKVTYITVKYDAGSESKYPLKVEAAK